MHLEIEKSELSYLMGVVRVFRTKCRTKGTALYLCFKDDCSELAYSSEGFFVRLKSCYVSEFRGEYGISLDFIKNILSLFDDGIIEIDFRDSLIVAHQGDTTLKGESINKPHCDIPIISEGELEEIPLQLTLSNKLLTLNLEEMNITVKDPYVHLYNINGDRLVKMSSFCALLQHLDKVAQCEATLTQDILNVCSIVSDCAQYFRYRNSFYIRDEKLELKMPLANIRFPTLDIIINKVKNGGEYFLIKSNTLLDICDKCCNLSLEKKIDRVDMVFKDNLIMYSYNNVLSGSAESGLTLEWKMSFNPLLMRNILKYINEECVTICRNVNTNTILVSNLDKTTTFMLALCR